MFEEQSCFSYGRVFYHNNILQDGSAFKTQPNFASCQESCLEIEDCSLATFSHTEKQCYLQTFTAHNDQRLDTSDGYSVFERHCSKWIDT